MIITLSSPYCFIAELLYLKHHSFPVKLSIYWWNQCKNLLNKDHTYSGCYFSFLLCWSQRCLNCFCNFSVILWSFILLSEFFSYQTTTHSVPKYPCLIVRRSSPSLCKCWKLLAFCSCVWVFLIYLALKVVFTPWVFSFILSLGFSSTQRWLGNQLTLLPKLFECDHQPILYLLQSSNLSSLRAWKAHKSSIGKSPKI